MFDRACQRSQQRQRAPNVAAVARRTTYGRVTAPILVVHAAPRKLGDYTRALRQQHNFADTALSRSSDAFAFAPTPSYLEERNDNAGIAA